MSACHQCEQVFLSHRELKLHLLAVHGLNENPAPRSLSNLYEVVRALEARVLVLEKLQGCDGEAEKR
jgi:hypothetical protein